MAKGKRSRSLTCSTHLYPCWQPLGEILVDALTLVQLTRLSNNLLCTYMYRVIQKMQPVQLFVKSTFLQMSTAALVCIASNDGQIMPQSYKLVAV